MDILPIKILTSDDRRFQLIALLVDRPEVEQELVKLIGQWPNKLQVKDNKGFQQDIFLSLQKLSLPNSLFELLSDCIMQGLLWKNYDLSDLEVVEVLQARKRRIKTLPSLRRDREWYWRHRSGESYKHIAKTRVGEEEHITKQGVLNAINRYKDLTGNR